MITPIVVPVNASPSKPDNKCPNCGHEWDNESEPMPLLAKLIVTFIVIAILYLIIGLFDCFNGGIMYNAILVPTVENYEIPDEWEILSNKKGRYIIKKGDYYLTRGESSPNLTMENHPNIYPPLKCTSEKRAKSTLKHYLDRREMNKFQ